MTQHPLRRDRGGRYRDPYPDRWETVLRVPVDVGTHFRRIPPRPLSHHRTQPSHTTSVEPETSVCWTLV